MTNHMGTNCPPARSKIVSKYVPGRRCRVKMAFSCHGTAIEDSRITRQVSENHSVASVPCRWAIRMNVQDRCKCRNFPITNGSWRRSCYRRGRSRKCHNPIHSQQSLFEWIMDLLQSTTVDYVHVLLAHFNSVQHHSLVPDISRCFFVWFATWFVSQQVLSWLVGLGFPWKLVRLRRGERFECFFFASSTEVKLDSYTRAPFVGTIINHGLTMFN